MTGGEVLQYVVYALSIISAIYVIVEKIFGGGNALATKFADLEKRMTERQRLSEERMQTQTSESSKNTSVGIDAINANIHRMEISFLTFRAQMAEEYLRREDYYKTIDEFKTDVKDANRETREEMRKLFSHLDDRLQSMQQSIDHTRIGRVPVNA